MDLASVLFSLEIFNFVAHICVLTGLRMLPRRALVKQHFYFIFDLVCCMLSFAIHRRAWPIILIQNIQHVYYIVTWDSSWPTKRVISWSSLDWDRGRWNQLDLVSGTLFDALVHAMNAYFLMETMSWKAVTIALGAVLAYSIVIFAIPGWLGHLSRVTSPQFRSGFERK